MSRPKIKVTCKECNKEFEVIPSIFNAGRGKYCCKNCYYKSISKLYAGENSPSWKKIDRVCQFCGTKFKTIRGKYCSRKCYHEYRRENPRKISRVIVICRECKKSFETRPSSHSIFCSTLCMYTYRGKHIRGENHPGWKGGKLKRICKGCGEEFKLYPSDIKSNRKYCSNKCYSKSISGENSFRWAGGISFEPYCPKFNNEFRERVRAFFGYQCQMPGCNHIWQSGEKRLAVHHINFNKDSCCSSDAPRLFVPLCPHPCHTKTNYNRHHWEELFTKLIADQYNGQCYLPPLGVRKHETPE